MEFHDHSFEAGKCRRAFDEMEVDGLVWPEHRSRGDSGEERIGNLSGTAGDRNFDGRFHS
jgi:hypothetical protein